MTQSDVGHTSRPLYSQVVEQLQALALSGPLGEATLLPPEWALAKQLGVSRGTLRHAARLLEERGLLSREIGRGTFVNPAARLRLIIWQRLLEVARPDSRFDLDFSKFIPDFSGSDACVEQLCALPEYESAQTLMVTPDNNLEGLRKRALADGKRLLACTYSMARGFVLLEGQRIAPPDRALAATLDGMERFASPLTLEQLQAVGALDLIVTGATAVTRNGVHFGKGQGYLDMEWGLLRELGIVSDETSVLVSAHDCQVIVEEVPHAEYDVTVDVIATPTQLIRCAGQPKPPGIFWERIPREVLATHPYLADVRARAFAEGHVA